MKPEKLLYVLLLVLREEMIFSLLARFFAWEKKKTQVIRKNRKAIKLEMMKMMERCEDLAWRFPLRTQQSFSYPSLLAANYSSSFPLYLMSTGKDSCETHMGFHHAAAHRLIYKRNAKVP